MIKILNDNDRLVIIIENDDNLNMQKITEEITKMAINLASPINQENIEGLEPINPQVDDVEDILENATEISVNKTQNTGEQQTNIQPVIEEKVEDKGEKNNENNDDISNIFYDPNYLYPGESPMDAMLSGETLVEKDKICVKLYSSCSSIKNKALKKIIVDDLKQYITNRFCDLSEDAIENLTKQDIYDALTIYEPLVRNGIKYILGQAGCPSLEDFLEESDEINLKSAYYSIISNLMKQSWLK